MMKGPEIVAEISANHNGSLERALKLIDACAAAGAHAVKFQTWANGTMVIDRSLTQPDGPWAGRNLHELYDEAYTPWEWHPQLFARAAERRIGAFTSVFDRESLAMLEDLGCPRYKVASFEIVDLPLIQAIGETRKPMILSTGMATRQEIDEAVWAARNNGCPHLTLLKCTSAYPADPASAHLASMETLRSEWRTMAGISDHTPGIGVAIAAAAMGAVMIEKHVTLSRADGGLDAAFSIEPAELTQLVREAERAAEARGAAYQFGPTAGELPQVGIRRSLYFADNLTAGTRLTSNLVRSARPALGIAPRHLARVMGATVREAVRKGQPVTWDAIELDPPDRPNS